MTRHEEPNPDEGSVEMHNGSWLYWKRNAAGGRTYTSDEIPTGVEVWDTCLTDVGTLCEAISMEFALAGVERRAAERGEHARQRAANPDAPAGSTAPLVRPADEGPCPNCGALGCWTPCPYELPVTHEDMTLRVHLIRARDQLLRYSSEDPMAAELTRLLGER